MTSSFTSIAVPAAEAAGETHLPMPPVAYALVTMAFFLFLLMVLFAFRNSVAPKHDPQHDPHHGAGHDTHGGDQSGTERESRH